jgi:ABC-type lipoprotein export system ATPase subunit
MALKNNGGNGSSRWLIETRDLTRIYGDGEQIRALDGVNLHIARGELATVMGPSGSGKSTLLNMLGALDKPTSGQALIDGHDLAHLRDVDAFRARKVGFIFQLHNLLPTLTARENIEIPMIGLGVPPAIRHKRATLLLRVVGLGDRLNHLPSQLSGGQRQRVAVARALANSPPLILADEPTGSLDTSAGRELMHLLRVLNRKAGTTFVIVTHDPAVARQTDRVLVMEDGRIVREDIIGSPLEEDLKMLRHSGLGRRLASNQLDDLAGLDLHPDEIAALQSLLIRVDGDSNGDRDG